MLHIKPIQQEHASPHIQAMYKSIEKVLNIDTVPLIFQYMANYQNYLYFIWDRMKTNLESDIFQSSYANIESFAFQSIEEIYTPSPGIKQFVQKLHPLEKSQLTQTIQSLTHTNAKLLLLLIDLREGMKSIFIGTERLTQFATDHHGSFTNEFTHTNTSSAVHKQESHEMTQATHMLVPLFGTNAIVVSHYPDFFAHVTMEMEKLKNTQHYLQKRVELEYTALTSITKFVQPLGCSYQEFMKLTKENPYINELLYLITDSFPSQFPHLVLTTTLMHTLLQNNNSFTA